MVAYRSNLPDVGLTFTEEHNRLLRLHLDKLVLQAMASEGDELFEPRMRACLLEEEGDPTGKGEGKRGRGQGRGQGRGPGRRGRGRGKAKSKQTKGKVTDGADADAGEEDEELEGPGPDPEEELDDEEAL